jgi:hypothetical protein
MAKRTFNAELHSRNGGHLTVNLEMYEFIEDGAYIIYCPALDMSAYGLTSEQARDGFRDMFLQYINYTTNKRTLIQDLQNHGWKVKGSKQKKMKSPSVKELIASNETLRDILYNKEYTKKNASLEMPELV